jgi:short subunit dehydrogenase-like uncharacterized protein
MGAPREFDIIVYGATGSTGRLVAEYLARRSRSNTSVRWAMAGRNLEKLATVRDEIGAASDTPLLVADAGDPESLVAMVSQSKAILSTVGPYQVLGSGLVAACARNGTDYVDLCGEVAWIRAMIDAHQATAAASGARIVFSSGFDSIPFELGVQFLQTAAAEVLGSPLTHVKTRVTKMQGGYSGGTAATVKIVAASANNPATVRLLQDPFALTPGFEGPPQPDADAPVFDPDVNAWAAPFVMASINTRVVHRSNFLLGHPYGREFLYDEMIVTGPGEQGEAAAKAIAAAGFDFGDDGPGPGEGPTKEQRDAGFYEIVFIGRTADGHALRAKVAGDSDPGYGSTSKMIAKSAICLITEAGDTAGGIWTPGSAMGSKLIERLVANAGLTFEIASLSDRPSLFAGATTNR